MSQRPWTAILSTGDKHVTAINITASLERHEAREEIESKHRGYSVVALIPGTHASSTLTFCQAGDVSINPTNKDSARWVDPYDTSHINTDSSDLT